MNKIISELVSFVYKNKNIFSQFKIAATGGGSLFQTCFALVPGISSFLIGNIYPYSEKETISYLGFRPEKLASEECALEMAMKAYQDSVEYDQKAFGIGISCALATERELKGGERAFLAIFGEDEKGKSTAAILSFFFSQPFANKNFLERRQEQEIAIASNGISFIFNFLQKSSDFNLNVEIIDLVLRTKIFSSFELQNQILKHHYYSNEERKNITPKDEMKFVLFPCTANPPHDGHFEMAYAIEHQEHFYPYKKVIFNLTFDPPHKNVVEPHEMLLRVKLILKSRY
jgi:nicotinamide mononucleotide (NMN) deamidase PncC